MGSHGKGTNFSISILGIMGSQGFKTRFYWL